MILKPTLFVLGAGASWSYGHPLGDELVADIISAKYDETVRNCLGCEVDLSSFREALRDSRCESIDAFLSGNPGMVTIGKHYIAAAINASECAPRTRQGGATDDWVAHLLDRMTAPPDDFHNNAIAVVTYNYDRSFEAVFKRAIAARYGLTDEEAQETAKKFDVIHVHGSLGSPWSTDGAVYRPYGIEAKSSDLRDMAESIRVIAEKEPDDSRYQEVTELFAWAERVIFLGFGYHPENCRRLVGAAGDERWNHFQRGDHRATLLGTAFGLSGARKKAVETRMKGRIQLGERQHGCRAFLEELWEYEE